MPVSINSQVPSNLYNLYQSSNRVEQNTEQLISGRRINDASDDPAGIQVLVNFSSQISGNNVAVRNSLDGISAIQVAEGGIARVNDSLQQIRELSVQAQNGILSDQDRNTLQRQADELLSGIQDTIGQTSFNGQSLLAQDGELSLQVGNNPEDQAGVPTFNLQQSFEDSGLFSLDITSPTALEQLDTAAQLLNDSAGQLGASQNGIESRIEQLQTSTLNQARAASQIGDTDFAQAVSDRILGQIQEQAGIAVQAQANAQRGLVLNLLNS